MEHTILVSSGVKVTPLAQRSCELLLLPLLLLPLTEFFLIIPVKQSEQHYHFLFTSLKILVSQPVIELCFSTGILLQSFRFVWECFLRYEVHVTKKRPHSLLGECIVHNSAVPCASFSSVHNVYYVRSFNRLRYLLYPGQGCYSWNDLFLNILLI